MEYYQDSDKVVIMAVIRIIETNKEHLYFGEKHLRDGEYYIGLGTWMSHELYLDIKSNIEHYKNLFNY